jgi:chromosome segregation ATPase
MEKGDEIDQFQILETKVESLIKYVGSLKQEKETLVEKVGDLEKRVAGMGAEVKRLHTARDQAKARIVKLLEKIEQLGV